MLSDIFNANMNSETITWCRPTCTVREELDQTPST